jgi:hypothetical protein
MEAFFENPPSEFVGKTAFSLYQMDSAMQMVDPIDRQAKLSNILAGFFPKPAWPTSLWFLIEDQQAQNPLEEELIHKFSQCLSRMIHVYFQDPVYDLPDFRAEFVVVLRGDDANKAGQIRQLIKACDDALAMLNRLPFDVRTSLRDGPRPPRGEKLWRLHRVFTCRKAVRHLTRFLEYLDLRQGADQRLADIERTKGEVRATKLADELRRCTRTTCWMAGLIKVEAFDEVGVFLRDNGPTVDQARLLLNMKHLHALQAQMPSVAFLEVVPSAQPQPVEYHLDDVESVDCFLCTDEVVVGVEFCGTCANNFCHYHCWREAAWEKLRYVESLTKDTPLPCFMCRTPAPLGDHKIVVHLPPSKRQRVASQ